MINKIEQRFKFIRIAISISIALLLALIIISFVSKNPMYAMYNLIVGPFENIRRIGNIVELMIPLLFTGVGVSIMYSADQINMASEGAFFLGGVAAAYVAVTFMLPYGIHPLFAILAGGTIGALVGVIPAILYVKFKALPVVSSLMLNYICFFMGMYVIHYIIFDPETGYLASFAYASTAILPKMFPITRIHWGLILGLLVVVFGYLFLKKSKWGYSIRMIGMNPNFAKYSGINVAFFILIAQIIGGAIAGIGGAVEQLGMYGRFQYQKLSGHGFDGVLVAILANYNPKFVPLAAFFIAYVRVGADVMARNSDVPIEIVSIIQSVIIVFVASERFLAGWKHRQIIKASQARFASEEV